MGKKKKKKKPEPIRLCLTEEEKRYIISICERENVGYHFASGIVYFITPFGHWYIDERYIISKKVKLMHENRNINGWHKQRIDLTEIDEIITYIHNHDFNKLKRENYILSHNAFTGKLTPNKT